MLAFMPQSPLLPVHTTMANKVSLAILPSAPMTFSDATEASIPSPSKRPKLSIVTSGVPSSTFGKGSTSLKLEALSATSPTSRNTFKNAYRVARTPSRPQKVALTQLETNVSSSTSPTSPSALDSSKDSATSFSSTSTASTTDQIEEVPYKLTYNVNSILRNSPLPRKAPRRITSFHTRTMFPAAKKVAFRSPLTEDIKNSKYTLRHSDIESSTPTSEPPSSSENDEETAESSDLVSSAPETKTATRACASSPSTRAKRNSPDTDEDELCASTPVAGRNKRRWVWTLGPVSDHDHSEKSVPEHNKIQT